MAASESPGTPTSTRPSGVLSGQCLVHFAFDLGFQVDLDAAGALTRESTRYSVVRARRPAPLWFDYAPPPLRLSIDAPGVEVAGLPVEPGVDVLVYDFGAALLTYRLPLPPTPELWPQLSAALYDNHALLQDARKRAQGLLDAIRPAVERPKLHEFVEDYSVFTITSWPQGDSPEQLAALHRQSIARAIEAETGELAAEQVTRSTAGCSSYSACDLAIVDWNAAVLFDAAPDDVLAVLLHANVELLELRVLDQELDEILDKADETMLALSRRRFWPVFKEQRMLARFASVQTDAAVMFEGVNNAIKLLGNQYLARLYRLAADRLDLPAWQRSVQRKLAATESVYQKMSDVSSTRRLETLEWVIIVLIALSMILPFVTPH